ncbi:MAG: ATP-binding protein [Elusimicrobiota bacterium]
MDPHRYPLAKAIQRSHLSIAAVAAAGLAVGVIICASLWSQMHRMRLTEEPARAAAWRIELGLKDSTTCLLQWLATKDDSHKKARTRIWTQTIRPSYAAFLALTAKISGNGTDTATMSLLDTIEETQWYAEEAGAVQGGATQDAVSLTTETLPLIEQAAAALAAARDAHTLSIDTAIRRAELSCAAAAIAAALGISILFILACRLGKNNATLIIRPVDALLAAANDLKADIIVEDIKIRGDDEFAGLSKAFNEMKRTLQESRQEAKKRTIELDRSNKELEQFAYIASHDLQEPLRKIINFTEVLSQRYCTSLDEKAKRYIDFAADGARRMQHLITDLLSYARLGRPNAQPRLGMIATALKEALCDLEIRVKETGASITTDDLPALEVNLTQFKQLFQNLIGNALKFKGEQAPVIDVGSRKEAGEWLFWVKDNGIGLEPQYAQRIFEIFQRLHTKEEYAGSGIGLAVCKKIVEMHAGKIWVESEIGKGSVFYFTLPIHTRT